MSGVMAITPYQVNSCVSGNIISFPTKSIERRCSTEMSFLQNDEEIRAVYNVFRGYIANATTLKKEKNARRNLTMFVCAINIGLRGGDFCKLKWLDVFDYDWNVKQESEFVPEKTERRDKNGNVMSRKYVKLRFNQNFRDTISEYLNWLKFCGCNPDLDDYIFESNKGNHIDEKAWYKIVERYRMEAGINRKIGTHGLRKTYGHRYYMSHQNKEEALIDLMGIFAHSDMRITLRYIGIMGERIAANQERMCMSYDED